jgi:DNA polymerase-1
VVDVSPTVAEPENFFDSMLSSQMIAAGDVQARHSLDVTAEVFAGIPFDLVDEQKSDWSARPLRDTQLEYAAWDAKVVIPVYFEQVRRLEADDLLRVAALEFDAIKPIARTEINGFHLDAEQVE